MDGPGWREGNGRAGEVGSRLTVNPQVALGGGGALTGHFQDSNSTLASTLAPLYFVPPGRWTVSTLPVALMLPSRPLLSQAAQVEPTGRSQPLPAASDPHAGPQSHRPQLPQGLGRAAGAPCTPLPKGLSPGHCQSLGKQSKQGDT